MIDEYRFKICAQVLLDITEIGIAQPEVDNVLCLNRIYMFETLVKFFKVITLKSESISIALVYTVVFLVLKTAEAILPKNVTTKMYRVSHHWSVVFEINKVCRTATNINNGNCVRVFNIILHLEVVIRSF